MHKDLRLSLTLLAAHSAAVNIHRRNGQDVALNKFFDDLLKQTPEQEKKASDFYKEAYEARRNGDTKKMVSLCETRKTVINNFIRAKSNYAELFFDTVTLGEGDQAEYINETSQQVAVGYLAADGKPRLNRAVQVLEHVLIPLNRVASDKQGYQLWDIQRGRIDGPAKRTFDIAADLTQKLDRNAYKLLTADLSKGGAFGDFVTTGPEHLRTFKLHKDIDPDNIADTNALELSDNTGSSKFRLAVVKAIVHYCDISPNGVRPTGIIQVPAKDASDLLDLVDPTAAKPSALAEGLLSNYTRFEYGDVVWTLVPDRTIPSGTCYAPLSKPVGTQFRKPSFDKEFSTPMEKAEEDNWEDRWMQTVQGLYIPVQQRPNAVSVKYKS